MQVRKVTHHASEALADPRIAAFAADVESVLARLAVPIWAGKSEKQKKLAVLQPVLNAMVYEELVCGGWLPEVCVTDEPGSRMAMTADFVQRIDDRLVVLEVQFGNAARLHSDLLKFIHLREEEKLALAITVTFEARTAVLADSGVANFGQVVRALVTFEKSLRRLPMVCFGVGHENSPQIDFEASAFPEPKLLSGAGAREKIHLAARELRLGTPIARIGAAGRLPPVPRVRDTGPQQALF